MEALPVIVRAELTQQMSQVTMTEDHEVIQALGTDGLHEPFRVRIAVRTAGWNRHALHALGLSATSRRAAELLPSKCRVRGRRDYLDSTGFGVGLDRPWASLLGNGFVFEVPLTESVIRRKLGDFPFDELLVLDLFGE